ncbi:putative NBD/HSP70 family sugar kinase/DNA-binding MurR/RpiR family transcriptional regulator [Bacillus sp. SORGH_AS 510]|uniref:ROK family protein n=1 Tax=Bacillus sp. SORGH_AS_0510 TaxID=3041771 RepID=UPI00277E9CAA|nr:ROK family protein [Bacillus sp. SORGH_AS_0510]MDQ1147713.1 putative NBD/HSP70 family sugar kinase/DNA-binding MurR/RpiR family transcriptional regulator [Bacillus sp. SORGH_AS_0510]
MRKFIAFDIGGTLIKYGVLHEDGTFIEKHECLTEAYLGGEAIIRKVMDCGRSLMDSHTISGICISTAGQVDSKEGKILYASSLIPKYTGTPVKKELEAFFQLPVEVENDVNCAGLAESWIGTGKDAKSLFCLTIGTGIGGSYILDNKLHTGHSFSGGEIGYIPIEGDQFQELASTRTLVRNVAKLKGIEENELNGKAIFELAQSGDEICIQEIERIVYYLSKGIATIAYMMNPEMIIIGGGITAQKDYLYPLIKKQLQKDIIPTILEKTKIEIAQNLNNAGMIGALRHFLLQESLQPLKSVTTIIESNLHKLTKREQMIAKYIIQNLESVPNRTISELSRQINVSEATITRFCQKLEFGSYNKLRLLAKEASVSTRLYEPSEMTSMSEVKESYLSMIKKFDTLHQQKDVHELQQNLQLAKQVYLYGGNGLSHVAEQFKFKLMKLGFMADAFTTSYQMEMSAYALTPETTVIALSNSGYTSDVVSMLEKAKDIGCVTVGITSQQDSPLAELSDICLLIPATEGKESETSFNGEVSSYYLLDVILKELQSNQTLSVKKKIMVME